MSDQLNKEKFVLANREDIRYDQDFKTKPIGYYKDAMNRFKKNKASVVAAIILLLLVIMAIIGPWLRPDNFFNDYKTEAIKLVSEGELPPYIEGLEWLGFNGVRSISRANLELDLLPLLEEDVVSEYGEIIITDLDTLDVSDGGVYRVQVNYYNYINYYISTSPMNIQSDVLQQIYDYEEETGEEVLLEEVRVWKNTDGSLVEGQTQRVRVKYFKFLEVIYDYEPQYPFGADQRGRDWFNVLWSGARVSLLIALAVSAINLAIGLIIGSISGYFGGTTDLIIERISEVIAGLPFLAIITLLILRFGSTPGVVIFAFAISGWLGISSLTRTQFYRYKGREYVLAARTLGAADLRIMYRHILPNAVGTLITSFVLYIPSVIFSESTFSFLGIINYADIPSVGRMLADSQSQLREDPSLGFLVLFPAIFVSLLMLSFNLFGNGLRDAFNPSLRGVEE